MPTEVPTEPTLDEQIADLQQTFADKLAAPPSGRALRRARRQPSSPPRTDPTPARPVPRRVEFTPRQATHRLLTALVLAALVTTGVAGWIAWRTGSQVDIVVAGIFGALALVLTSIRATIVPVRLVIDAGQLTVARGRVIEVHDLTSRYSRILLQGDPQTKQWQILLERPDAAPTVVDHDVVDGAEFVRVVEYWRPTLRSGSPFRPGP